MTEPKLQSVYRKHKNQLHHEVDKRLDTQLSRYAKKISEVVGEPLPIKAKLTRKEIQSIHDRMDSTMGFVFSTFDTDFQRAPDEEIWKRLRLFLNKWMAQYHPVPKGKEPLQYYKEQLDVILSPRRENSIQQSFFDVSESAGWLVGQLVERDRLIEAQTFLTGFLKSDEAFSLAQIYVQGILPTFRRLDRILTKHLEKRDVQYLIRSYELLAGVYERLCRIVLALDRIRRGEDPRYDDVKKRGLARTLLEISNEPSLASISSKVDTRIRNSIAHPSYRVRYARRRVEFENGLDLTWNQFRTRTTALSIGLFSLTFTPFLHYLRDMMEWLDKTTTVKSVSESEK